ncbi:hypothetical protein I6G76_01145 (plasmid) [Bacillus cereus]|uniref:Hypotheical protein n=1 Tax=Bacillus cereus (strain ZK / E33L) TaxID=288681 RepID=Q4V190_BACCZ|nr:hypothetical protein [Bacillus cereus]AAY60517.1 hypotheical protein [Bacillus cereus E33L]AJI26400.1 hypothetical protein BF28_5902 [Bacillus cereus E33L]QQA18953.1 hypothetical protein I6G76_01145 [Bacillus cereus]
MKKTLAISAITLALTGMGASSSFASSENVSVSPEKVLQSKAAKVNGDGFIVGQYFNLQNGEVSRPLEHKKDADLRISITNKSTGGVHWYLKDPSGRVIAQGDLAKDRTSNITHKKLTAGNYQLRVVSDINGTGSIYIGARTLE